MSFGSSRVTPKEKKEVRLLAYEANLVLVLVVPTSLVPELQAINRKSYVGQAVLVLEDFLGPRMWPNPKRP
jgi:hypothetical protein